MYSTAHLALGLIIGKVTNDYPTAIISSVAIDIDHLIPFVKNKIIFNFKKMWATSRQSCDTSRSYLHSFFAWAVLTGLISIYDYKMGAVFALGYLGHFLLDAVDDSDFYPFFPIKRWNTKGFIGYFSKTEFVVTIALFACYFFI